MLTFLDLLVVVFMILAASSVLALCLMFFVRKPMIKKVCFYIVSILGIYVSTVSIRIFWPMFLGQCVIGVLLGIVGIVALLLVLLGKGDEKKFKAARILAAVSLVLGMVNAFLV